MSDYNLEIGSMFDITCELSRYAAGMDSILQLLVMHDNALPLMPEGAQRETAWALQTALMCTADSIRQDMLALCDKLVEMKTLPEQKKEAAA